MNISKVLCRISANARCLLPRSPTVCMANARYYHVLSSPSQALQKATTSSAVAPFLSTPLNFTIPSAGLKVVGKLRRRCRDCYFEMIDERLFVMCKTHPRHKQAQMIKKVKNTYILTHATQGKIRAW